MASFDPAVVVAALKKGGLYGAPYTPKAWVPTVDLGVAYPDSGAIVSLGNKLTPKETAPYPALAFAADPDSTHSVVVLDPDAPVRSFPIFGTACHWIQANIKCSGEPGSTKVEALDSSLTPYGGPGPPPFMGFHRYVFLLYKHTTAEGVKPLEAQATVKNNTIPQRMWWNLEAFVKENKLEIVGVNYFLAKSGAKK